MADWSPVDLLPALWVGVLGGSLAWALRRWYDPIPARVLGVFVLALGILLGQSLFSGGILMPLDNLRGQVPFQRLEPTEPPGNLLQGDLIELVAPSLAAVRAAWREGSWPLWNRQVGAGMPLLADPQAQAFQPLVLLGYPFPPARAAGVVAALRVLLALVFGFLWMRRQGLGEGPALAGSLAFGLGGFLLLWLGWPLANSAAFLPLVLYAAARCDDSGRRRDALLLALGTLALLLGGHPETISYALGMAVLFLLDRVRRRPRGLRWALARRGALAMAIAGMVAAPALLPAIEYLPKTMRAARMASPDRGAAAGAPTTPSGSRAVQTYLPLAALNAYGDSRFAEYWGLANSNEDASGFVGTATLLAALLAARARRRFPQERLALGITAVCLLLIAPLLGGSSLGSHRLLLPLSLCLAYLAACTLERFQRGEVRRWPLLIAALALGAVLAWGYLAHPDPADPERLAVFRFGWLRWQLRFLGLAILLLAGTASWRRPARFLAVAGVAAAILAELLLLYRPVNPPMPRQMPLPVNGPIAFLQWKLGQNPQRGPGYRMAALGRDFPPNLATLYGLPDARIYNPMAPQAYVERLAPILAGWWGEVPELGAPGHPLYSRLGVRYLLAAPDAELPPPLQQVYADADGSVWEQPAPRTRLFLDKGRIGSLRIPRSESSWITAWIVLPQPRRLGSVVYQDGGWRILVNGVARPPEREPGVFLSTVLPAGRMRMDVLYRPAGFLWGCVIAALGLAVGVAFAPLPRPNPHPPAPSPVPSHPPSPGEGEKGGHRLCHEEGA